MATTAKTPRADWIEEGLRALGDGGPDAVRVEPLAKTLGLTKGSFYWHFDDRQALLEKLLGTWEKRMIDDVIERVETEGGDAKARLRLLFSVASAKDARTMARAELAIRDWARTDKKVAARLQRVDNRRMDYMRSLFAEFSDDDDEVEARCLLTFSLFVGSGFIHTEHGARSRREVTELAMALLLDSPR
jgi:AcrR family transcriptional regulator